MPLRYHTTNTITNGVKLTPENVGRQVEWVSALKDLETGEYHRVHLMSGIYEGNYRNPETRYLYAEFSGVLRNGEVSVFYGAPRAWFTLAEDYPRTNHKPEPQTYPKGRN